MRAQEFIAENADQAAVDALLKKHGWSTGQTANGDLAMTWQGNTYVFYGERVRITQPNGQSVSVVWGQKPDWHGRPGDISFAQAVQQKYLTFDLPIWQALDRRQINDSQAMQRFKAENERQAREAVAQGLTEAFDQPYKLKWYPGDWDEVTAYADIPDGDDLTIIFNNDENEEGEEAWSVEFYRNDSQEITGEGDAQRIFATVLVAIKTFIKKYKPNRLIFSASKEVEPGQKIQSRANLYDRLVQRYAQAMGYRAFRADAGNKVHYELSRINKGVAENAKVEPVTPPLRIQPTQTQPKQNVYVAPEKKQTPAVVNHIKTNENRVGELNIGPINVVVDDHAIDRTLLRNIDPHAVDAVIRKLPGIKSDLDTVSSGEKIWVYDPGLNVALGLRRISGDRLRFVLKTLWRGKPMDLNIDKIIKVH